MATALIDGDIVAYMAAVLAQDEVFPPLPGEDPSPPSADRKKAMRVARDIMDKWEHAAGCNSRRVALTDRSSSRSSFRYAIHPHYKNQRTSPKPVLLEEMNEYLIDRHHAEMVHRLEGDDLLGIWQTSSTDDDVIVSKDKDMLTIPGRVLIIPHMQTTNFVSPIDVNRHEAANHLFLQVLTGDPTDNYLGAPGVGKVKAQQYLQMYLDEGNMSRWDVIVKAYTYAWEHYPRQHGSWVHPGKPETEALMNMRCARILHAKDYRDNQIGLWAPKGDREWI